MDTVDAINTAGKAVISSLGTGLAGVLLLIAGIKWGYGAGIWVMNKIGRLFGAGR